MERLALALMLAFLGVSTMRADDLSDALARGSYQEAVRIADAALRHEPGNLRAWTIRAMALDKLGRRAESLASFERALRLEPDNLVALKGATQVAYAMRSPQAGRLVARVLALEPASETAHAIAGALAVEAHRCADAVTHFSRSGSALRGNAPALGQYGACLVELHRPGDAVPLFQELLQLAPGEWTASYNLAVACHDAGLATEGLATLRSALDSWPDNPDLLSLYASLSAEAGQLEAAIRALRAAIAAQPRNERHYVDLAALCLDHDALDLAMEVVSAGLANVSESAKLHTLSGAIHAERGELDQAMREFDEASRLSPSDLYGSVGLSLALRQADRLPEALSLLRRKLSERPRDATLNFLLADVLMRSEPAPGTREFHEARLALARAVRGKPNFAGAHAALGKLLLREGRGAEAVQELRTAAGLDGTDRVALNQLVLAYRQLGQEEAAAQAAGELRSLLQRQRVEEVARNRVRLARREADPQPR